MTAPAECPPPVAGQWLVRAVLRGAVRLLFRGLVRPPMPIAGQRAVLRLLTAATLTPRGVTRTQAAIKGVPCEWLRPTRRSGNVLLYLHGGAYLIGSPATRCSTRLGCGKRWSCIAHGGWIGVIPVYRRCLPIWLSCRRG